MTRIFDGNEEYNLFYKAAIENDVYNIDFLYHFRSNEDIKNDKMYNLNNIIDLALFNGHLEPIKYAHRHGGKCSCFTLKIAKELNYSHIVEWLNKYCMCNK